MSEVSPVPVHPEDAEGRVSSKLNWLRAGVLGASDGIVSTAGLVVGVAAASTDRVTILTAGLAGLVAGALSMAAGEYVSVSTQRDVERALLAKERWELENRPDEELEELAGLYRAKGLSDEVSHRVAAELTAHDALAAHAEVELGLDPNELTNPWQAAFASMLSFSVGAVLPLIAVANPAVATRIPLTVIAVVLALIVTGFTSSTLGRAPRTRSIIRNVVGGLLAMGVTWAIGSLVGQAI